MNVRLSKVFSIKNIFYDKMDLRLFYFDVVTHNIRDGVDLNLHFATLFKFHANTE